MAEHSFDAFVRQVRALGYQDVTIILTKNPPRDGHIIRSSAPDAEAVLEILAVAEQRLLDRMIEAKQKQGQS